MALACYGHQTYQRRELVVMDDGEVCADECAVKAAGGQLVRMTAGTALGTKLNQGIEEAEGAWCLKMDDDDWYAPGFLDTMVTAVAEKQREVCRPVVAFVMPFLFFHVVRWEIRRSIVNHLSGGTLLFAREDWKNRPFRPLSLDEDLWFLLDQFRSGAIALPVRSLDSYLAVRHPGSPQDRGHTWVHQSDGGTTVEAYLGERPLYRRPEDLLPDWAIAFYRKLREELLATASET